MTRADGLLRLIAVYFRRYSRDPATRLMAARHLLAASVTLYAEHTSPGEAALATAETVAELAREERLKARAVQ